MKKVNCPKCGKELIRLEPFEEGVYEFWCDECDLDITIAENEEKQPMKAVKQISLDILVGSECDGVDLAEEVMDELERRGYTILGAGFQEDLTDAYEESLKEV